MVPLTLVVPLAARTVPLLLMLPVWVIGLAPASKTSAPATGAMGAAVVEAVDAGLPRTLKLPLTAAGAVGAMRRAPLWISAATGATDAPVTLTVLLPATWRVPPVTLPASVSGWP